MEFFDSHSHITDERFNNDREYIIDEIRKEEITKWVNVGYDLESSKKSIQIANDYEFIYATVGISPNDIPQEEEKLWKDLNEIENLLNIDNHKIVAIGEIGLDYYWNKQNKDIQNELFIKQIELANKYNYPIAIHTREAVMDTIKILKENEINKKGIFHCCPLNRELVKEALKLDFYISFAGPITFKNSKNADEIINMVPVNKILIETDSPYLSPEPYRGKRNDPRNVKYIAKKIANVKEKSLEEIAKVTYENALRIYNI